jgi:hypothetical protein
VILRTTKMTTTPVATMTSMPAIWMTTPAVPEKLAWSRTSPATLLISQSAHQALSRGRRLSEPHWPDSAAQSPERVHGLTSGGMSMYSRVSRFNVPVDKLITVALAFSEGAYRRGLQRLPGSS